MLDRTIRFRDTSSTILANSKQMLRETTWRKFEIVTSNFSILGHATCIHGRFIWSDERITRIMFVVACHIYLISDMSLYD